MEIINYLVSVYYITYTFTWPAYILPLMVGSYVLIKYRKDVFCIAAALFALKPFVATPLWAAVFAPTIYNPPPGASYFYTLLPPIILTSGIVIAFRGQLRSNPQAFMRLIVFDVIRWLYTFNLFAPWWGISPSLSSSGIPYTNLWYLIALILPNAYAGMVYELTKQRARRVLESEGEVKEV